MVLGIKSRASIRQQCQQCYVPDPQQEKELNKNKNHRKARRVFFKQCILLQGRWSFACCGPHGCLCTLRSSAFTGDWSERAESKPGCVHSDTGSFFRKLSGSDMFAEGDSWRFAQDCPVGNCCFQTRETDVDPEPWL